MNTELLGNYKGPAIPERLQSFLALLKEHSFDLVVTGDASKTIRLFAQGANLGYVNGPVVRRGVLFGYRFTNPASDSCPKGLESSLISSMCERFECEPQDLAAYEESGANAGRTFLLFKEPMSALRALQIEARHPPEPDVAIAEISERFVEGRIVEVVVHKRERDPRARSKCLSTYGFSCFVCGLNVKAHYVGLPVELVHVHHEEPLHLSPGEREFNPDETLKPLCPNCHCVAHARNPPYTVQELRAMLKPET